MSTSINCKSSVANRLRIAIHKLRYIHFLLYAAVFFFPPTLLSLMASHTAWTVFCCSRSLNMQLYKQSIRTQGEVNPTCSFKVAGHLGISLFRRAGVQVRLNSARIEQGKINSWQEVNIFHLGCWNYGDHILVSGVDLECRLMDLIESGWTEWHHSSTSERQDWVITCVDLMLALYKIKKKICRAAKC